MPIDIVLENTAKSIIRITFIPPWTWEQFDEVVVKSRQMRATVAHDIATFFDFSAVHTLPSGALGYFRREYQRLLQNEDILIVVGANALVRSIGRMVAVISARQRKNIFYVDTMADAHALLADLRLPK